MKQTGDIPVPLHLRNAPTKLMKELGYGENYKYSHDYPNNFVEQEFLPKEVKTKKFWNPQKNPAEQKLTDWLHKLWKNRY